MLNKTSWQVNRLYCMPLFTKHKYTYTLPKNRLRGLGAVGVENRSLPFTWPIAYTTAYITVQGVIKWLVWRSGNGVRHINEVKLRRVRLVLGLVTDLWRVCHPGIYPGHSGQLSLAVPPWISAMSTGDAFGHSWKETAPLKLRPYGAL